MKFIFADMDGTLTESRQKATNEMIAALKHLDERHKIHIVSGAELSRMMLQIPLNYVAYFSQNGNIIYDRDRIIRKNELENKEDILEHIDSLKKDYPDAEVEDRGSQITVSFTGFNAPQKVKDKFDPDRRIRLNMLRENPHPNAYVAGLTGIDYMPKTKGENIEHYLKLRKIKPRNCLYIGDALEEGANDYSVIGVIPTHAVKNPQETLEFIKTIK